MTRRYAFHPLALTVTLAAASITITVPAAAAPSGPCGSIYGQRATAVGLPTLPDQGRAQSGAVDVRSYDHTASRVSLSSLDGGLATTGARFGAAVVIQDVDHDGCEDLVVGAPGGTNVEGSVRVVRGTLSGVSSANSVTITAPDGRVGDEFGASVAVDGVQSDGTQSVWIGAPGATVGGQPHAGKVYHFVLDGQGAATFQSEAGYAARAVPGAGAADDRFGSVLSIAGGLAANTSAVLVGVPLRDVDGKTNAGEVMLLHETRTSTVISGYAVSQASAGVPGTPEPGDHFGAALSAQLPPDGRPGLAVVGIPGEDVGSVVDAGAVQVLFFGLQQDGDAAVSVGTFETQGANGLPGAAETGDEFGAAVAMLTATDFNEQDYAVAVGSPGESLGAVSHAGSVTIIAQPYDFPQTASVIYQGRGYPGTAERNDRFGATLSTIKTDLGSTLQNALIGIPGEDGLRHDSGLVQPTSQRTQSWGSVTGPIQDLRYGSVLAVAGVGDLPT